MDTHIYTQPRTRSRITHSLFCFVLTAEMLMLVPGKCDCYNSHWPYLKIPAIFMLGADECYSTYPMRLLERVTYRDTKALVDENFHEIVH